MKKATYWFRSAVLASVLGLTASEARAEGEFVPSAALGLRDLQRQLGRRSAVLQGEQMNVELALAESQQSRLPGNPVVDFSWGTIPVGPTNPANLASPMLHVPNYSFGLSYTFLLGKRPARVRRAAALEDGARASYQAAAHEQALGLARVLGRLAAQLIRREGLVGLVEQGKGTVALARSRLGAGQGTPLEVDRLEIELGRTEQQALAAESEEQAALAGCAVFVGGACGPFATAGDARAFLVAWIDRASKLTGDPEAHPELRALEAQQRAAEAEAELARSYSLPDPTVRLGYTYDTFLISGNQNHSLSLSVALPLPFFDRGQAALAAARARQVRLDARRRQAATSGRARLAPLRSALEQQRRRQEAVSTRLLPRARAALADLERAAQGRLLPLTEVIPARRTVNELLVEEADSLADAFQTAIDIFALLPPASAADPPP